MTERVSFCSGAVTGLSGPTGNQDLPLLIMVPGGGSQAAAFDIPGQSFLETASKNGFSAIAINRPGQADSKPLEINPMSDQGIFAANADALLTAIDEIWSRTAGSHPGVVIYGSSIGGAMSLHMAARWSQERRGWPLLGVSVADIGQKPPQNVVDTWRNLDNSETVDLAKYFPIFFGTVPSWTLSPPPSDAPPPELLIPRAELQEVVGGWPREWHEVASKIIVPSQYVLAEHDSVWEVSNSLLSEFGSALERASPYVEAKIMAHTSHGIGLGSLAKTHMLEVLAFVSRCSTMRAIPEMLED